MPPVLGPSSKVLIWVALIATVFPSQVLAARGIIVGQEWERYQHTRGHVPQDPPVGMRGMIGWDPQAQIRCVGEVPNMLGVEELLPDDYHNNRRWLTFSGVYENLRELCAKPAYGGSITAFSAGGYCARNTSPPTVLFERLPPGGTAMTDVFRRVFLYCQHHCFCIEGDYQELQAQGRPAAEILDQETYGNSLQIVTDHNGIRRRVYDADYRIDEALPPRATLFRHYPPPSAFSPIPVYFLAERQTRTPRPGSLQGVAVGVLTVWMNPFEGYMPILCRGEMTHPSVVEGSPTSRQAVCASDWYGGSKKGNAGFLCLPDPNEESYTFGHPVLSTEASVAHPVYYNVVQNSEGDASRVIAECYSFCRCANEKQLDLPYLWALQLSEERLPHYDGAGRDASSISQGTTGLDGTSRDAGNIVLLRPARMGTGPLPRDGLVKAVGGESGKGGRGRSAGLAQFAKVEGRLDRQCVAEGRVRGFDLEGGLKTVLDCSKGKRK